MYRCPRLVDVPLVVELPTVMYPAPPFNVWAAGDAPGGSAGQSCPETSVLEARQEAVLKRLQTLKERLDRLTSTRVANTNTAAAAAAASPIKTSNGPIQELVISAPPSCPPLSLLPLRRLLGQHGRHVYSASRVHSSVAKVSEALQAAFTSAPLGERSHHSLAFSVQWTDTHTPSLMVSPLRQTRIEGEANILRYVSRLLPPASPFHYEARGDDVAVAEVNDLLDTLERQLAGGGGGKGRQAAVRCVAARLAVSPYLCGAECGLADLLAWSLLRQRGQGQAGSGQQPAVVSWMAKMDGLAGMDLNTITQQQQQQQQPKQNKQTTTPPLVKEEEEEGKQVLPPKGKKHLGRKELEEYLKGLGIPYQVVEHRAVLTVAELMAAVQGLAGVLTKNLFLRDKRKNLFLLSTRHDTEVDLKAVAKQAGTKDLRLADESVLVTTLGVTQGSVSAFALINDAPAPPPPLVRFLLEASAVASSVPCVYFHPLTNTATFGVTPDDLKRFLAATGHEATMVTLG